VFTYRSYLSTCSSWDTRHICMKAIPSLDSQFFNYLLSIISTWWMHGLMTWIMLIPLAECGNYSSHITKITIKGKVPILRVLSRVTIVTNWWGLSNVHVLENKCVVWGPVNIVWEWFEVNLNCILFSWSLGHQNSFINSWWQHCTHCLTGGHMSCLSALTLVRASKRCDRMLPLLV
jgi:hypothetical protein